MFWHVVCELHQHQKFGMQFSFYSIRTLLKNRILVQVSGFAVNEWQGIGRGIDPPPAGGAKSIFKLGSNHNWRLKVCY